MSGRVRAFVVSMFIGLCLPAVFTGGLAAAAIATLIGAAVLWVVVTIERPQPDILLPIAGLILGFAIAFMTGALVPMPIAVLAIAGFVLFA
jgi:hypothetical protein